MPRTQYFKNNNFLNAPLCWVFADWVTFRVLNRTKNKRVMGI